MAPSCSHRNPLFHNRQIDSGNFNLEKSKINIYNIIRKVVSSFEPLVKERDGRINLKFESDNHYLLADEVHLTNIIYNLIDNAFKYSNQKPESTIGVRESDDGLVITIRAMVNPSLLGSITSRIIRSYNPFFLNSLSARAPSWIQVVSKPFISRYSVSMYPKLLSSSTSKSFTVIYLVGRYN